MAIGATNLSPSDALRLAKLRALRAQYEILYRAASPVAWRRDFMRRAQHERAVATAIVPAIRLADAAMLQRLPAILRAVKRNVPAVAKQEVTALPPELQALIASLLDQGIDIDSERMQAILADLGTEVSSVMRSAGAASLADLGLGIGYQWANDEATAQAMFPGLLASVQADVRQALRTRAARVARIIVRGADPSAPRTIPQIMKEIREIMPTLSRQQTATIARTETARVYGTVDHETMLRNGIEYRRWITASGSPVASSKPPCAICMMNADYGWTQINQPFPGDVMYPPQHPRCRCSTIADVRNWLPPRVPFTGEEAA